MLKLYDLLHSILEIQSEYRVCYYDYDAEERVIVKDTSSVEEKDVRYIYCEDGVIYIEIDMED